MFLKEQAHTAYSRNAIDKQLNQQKYTENVEKRAYEELRFLKLSLCLFLSLSVYLSLSLFLSLSVYLSLSFCLSLSISLSHSSVD